MNIAFYGRDYKDFPIYLGFLLNNLGHIVRVNDRTRSGICADMIKMSDFKEKMKTYKGIDFYFYREYSAETEQTGNYDYVFDLFDNLNDISRYVYADILIINMQIFVSDFFESEILREKIKKDTILIIRDCVKGDVNKKYINRYVTDVGKFKGYYCIDFDEKDKRYLHRLDYDGMGKMPLLSESFSETLLDIADKIWRKPDGDVFSEKDLNCGDKLKQKRKSIDKNAEKNTDKNIVKNTYKNTDKNIEKNTVKNTENRRDKKKEIKKALKELKEGKIIDNRVLE